MEDSGRYGLGLGQHLHEIVSVHVRYSTITVMRDSNILMLLFLQFKEIR